MEKIRQLKRQRNLLLIGALPFFPVILGYLYLQRVRKKRVWQRALETFAGVHGTRAEEISGWLDRHRADVRARLTDGRLAEMLEKARRIDPILPAFSPKQRILVQPFALRGMTFMVNSILELQESVGRARFDTIVLTSDAAEPGELRALLDGMDTPGDRCLVVDTSRKGGIAADHAALRIFDAAPHAKLLTPQEAETVVFEFVRSTGARRVIIADSDLGWGIFTVYGRALAASAQVEALFSVQPENPFTNQNFYRYFDQLDTVLAASQTDRDHLVARFNLCPEDAARVVVAGSDADTSSRRSRDVLPLIGGTNEPLHHAEPDLDVSMVVTVHDETVVTAASMKAANAAAAAAERAGFTVEKVIALDTATDRARACMKQPVYEDWTVVEVTDRDLGRTRNRLVRMSRGRFVAFLDADDLFSENWLAQGAAVLDDAARRGERVIAHPEINWIFDRENAIFAVTPQESPVYSPALFYFTNYYDSLCMAPRDAHLELPYVSRDIPNGLSYQDYQFSIETIAAGWTHRIAKDTIIFKRRRDNSLVTESRDSTCVVRQMDAMAADKVMGLGVEQDRSSKG